MNRIAIAFLMMIFASSCAQRQATSVLTPPQHKSMESKTLLYVNEYRKSKNLSPLVNNEVLAQIARSHSLQMQAKNKMDHANFSERTFEIQNYYPQASVAENVGYNQGFSTPEKKMVDSWIHSKGHQQNIVGNYRLSGIGITKGADGKIYFTHLFVNP